MTEIQNIFSGQGSAKNQVSFDDTMFVEIKVVGYNLFIDICKHQEIPSSRPERSFSPPNFSEIQDLGDEGLVSSNRERFTTGNILGAGERRRSSAASTETNYIDKKHIDSLTSKFEETASGQTNKQNL